MRHLHSTFAAYSKNSNNMNPITNNQFLAAMLEEAAWKEVSSKEGWTMEALEKYQDKVDWKEISSNSDVMWTVDGISKFMGKIIWEEFSRNCPEYLLTEDNLLRFKGNWNWSQLSRRSELYNNWALLDMVTDLVDWKEIITNWDIKFPIQFFKRYEKYIPMSQFQDSSLWDDFVRAMRDNLKGTIAGIN